MNVGELRRALDWLNQEDGLVEVSYAVSVLGGVLEKLLPLEGFSQFTTRDHADSGFDFAAATTPGDNNPIKTLGILYKHQRKGRPLGVQFINEIIRAGTASRRDQVMFISRSGFTKAASDAARNTDPVAIQLFDLFDLVTCSPGFVQNRI
jgi:hypothetical protein